MRNGWELAGSIRVSPVPHRWAFVGGDEDADSVSLHIVVQHPSDPELVQRRTVRIPLRVAEEGLVVGDPEIA